MTRPRTALLAAVAGLGLLAGCGGQRDATQGSVRDQVEELLLENGYEGTEFSAAQASSVAACVAETMFESSDFTKSERNEASHPLDGERPSDELVQKVQDLVDGCVTEGTTAGPAAPSADDSTTTTEG